MNVLFSWIGFKDLNFFDSQLGDPDFHRRLEDAKSTRPTVSKTPEYRPIFSVINRGLDDQKPFSRAVLLFDLDDPVLSNGVKKCIGRHCNKVEVKNIRVAHQNIHEYNGELWQSAIAELDKIKRELGDEVEPFFNLSSGTAAMKALLMVWGQTVYRDRAKFAQVHYDDKKNIKVDISPFNFDVGSFAATEALNRVDLSEFDSITGESAAIHKAKTLAAKAARTDFNVLIYGETGTGKELLAQAIHKASDRREKQFLPVNCATLPPQLAESILFGYKKGSHSLALEDTPGLFKNLDCGTIFLDEIEACPPEVQAKLLRVLQPPKEKGITCRQFSPLGATNPEEEEETDVRIIGATNQRLENLEDGDFRKDLLTRLATLSITLPPLRERREDIPDLAKDILKKIKKNSGGMFSTKKFDESAIKFMESCEWPGNVRQLQNALVQAVVFGEGDLITADDFDQTLLALAGSGSTSGEAVAANAIDLSKPIALKKILKVHEAEIQKRYIDAALKKTNGNKTRAAKLLGIKYQTMDNWQNAWKQLEAEKKP